MHAGLRASVALRALSAKLDGVSTRFRLCALRTGLLALGLFLGGCGNRLPRHNAPQHVHALSEDEASKTDLGRLIREAAPSQDISGFRLLASGKEALGTLIALADRAQRTLDLQYYLIRSDGSSRAIMRHVWLAADRGVRVRLLLDDFNTAGQDDALVRLTKHRNIDVRLYNPLPSGRLYIVSRLLSSLTDLDRINHRMHNKMFVADNVLAVTGGRNLGDSYFLRDKESNFLDIDVLAAGPAVRALSATFDRFWNDPLAYPAGVVAGKSKAAPATPHETASVLTPDGDSADATDATREGLPLELGNRQLRLDWAEARVLADKPSKREQSNPPSGDSIMNDDINRLFLSAQRELLIITPYFVPGQHGMAVFQELRRRGVRVRVLTNSLATTDAPAVHIGYSRYRMSLLDLGVQLYELQPDLRMRRKTSFGWLGSSRASLHAKVMVVDGRVAIVMHSQELAKQLLQVSEEAASHSYSLSLSKDRRVQWQTYPPDPGLHGRHEPGSSMWLRIGLTLLGPFAPDEML